MRRLRGGLALAYPFLLFAGLYWFEPRHVALALAAALGLRLLLAAPRLSRATLRQLAVPVLCAAAVLGPTLALNDPRALLFVPVGVNLALGFAFARTLRRGPPLVETLARLQEPDLSPAQVRHCRSVTAVWCGFFAVNAGVCLALALLGDLWLWTLYTGFLSYLAMAALYGAELLIRSWRFHDYRPPWASPVLQRLFPQGPSA